MYRFLFSTTLADGRKIVLSTIEKLSPGQKLIDLKKVYEQKFEDVACYPMLG